MGRREEGGPALRLRGRPGRVEEPRRRPRRSPGCVSNCPPCSGPTREVRDDDRPSVRPGRLPRARRAFSYARGLETARRLRDGRRPRAGRHRVLGRHARRHAEPRPHGQGRPPLGRNRTSPTGNLARSRELQEILAAFAGQAVPPKSKPQPPGVCRPESVGRGGLEPTTGSFLSCTG